MVAFWLLLCLASSGSSVHALSSTNTNTNKNIQRVTVFGGTGFVGSRVCQALVEDYNNLQVTSVSQSGVIPQEYIGQDWTNSVTWNQATLGTDDANHIQAAANFPQAVISCVGAIGTNPTALRQGNGAANVAAFQASASAAADNDQGGLQRAVLIGVSADVADLPGTFGIPDFVASYVQGKQEAAAAALEAVNGDTTKCTVIQPSFIYGGSSFGIAPPRVTTEYGSAVEQVLSWPIVTTVADLLPPGLVKVALRPPVSVTAVAKACAAAAVGDCTESVIDGTAAIKALTNDPPATGFSDAIKVLQEQAAKAWEWSKVNVPKALQQGQEILQEFQDKQPKK